MIMKTIENQIGHSLEGWNLVEKNGIKYLRMRGTKTTILIELTDEANVYNLDFYYLVRVTGYDGVLKFYSDACTLESDSYYNYVFIKGDKI